MNATQLLAVEVPLAARLIELLDDGKVRMHADDYRSVSAQLLESLAYTPTTQLIALAREHGEYGPVASPRRRLRVLGELAANVAFMRLGRLVDVAPAEAGIAREMADELIARVR